MPDAAWLCYHKDAGVLYAQSWLDHYVDSTLSQTYPIDILEIDYGGTGVSLFGEQAHRFWSEPLPSHADAQNFLLDYALGESSYSWALNSNVDDWYASDRASKQVGYLRQGADVVSADWVVVDGADNVLWKTEFSGLNVANELRNDHNILCHPVIAYSRRFWEDDTRYVPEQIPEEDLRLWRRKECFSTFVIIPEFLIYKRYHPNSICERLKRA
jgi:hypothetical protein